MGIIRNKLVICVLSLFGFFTGNAQCLLGATTVSDNTISSYTVTPAESITVVKNFTYTGHIHLHGGTLCNNGTITKLTMKGGVLENNGVVSTATLSDLTVNLSDNLTLNINTGSKFLSQDDLTIVSSNQTNTITINIHDGAIFSCSDDFLLENGNMNLNVGLAANSFSNFGNISSSFNINGNLNLEASSNVHVSDIGNINVTGYTHLKNGRKYDIDNYGLINTVGNFSLTGHADSSTVTRINNFGEFTSYGDLICSLNNGTTLIENIGASYTGEFYVGGDLNIKSAGIDFLNQSILTVGNTANFKNGTMTNNGAFTAYSFIVETATVTNNSKITVEQDLLITDEYGVLKNNDFILSLTNIENEGTIELGKKSVLKTINFVNHLSPATVQGPADLLDETEENVDYRNYARVVIDENSVNDGSIDGYVIIKDYSYVGAPPNVDSHDNGTFGGDVSYVVECEYEMFVGFISAKNFEAPKGHRTSFCPDENVYFHLMPFMQVTSSIAWSYTVSHSSAMTFGDDLILMGVQSAGTVVASGTYWNGFGECSFRLEFTFGVGNAVITAISPVHFGNGNSITLNSTPTVGNHPFQYSWMPNVFFVPPSSNTVEDPVVAPQVSMVYTVTATDFYGCIATTTVTVIGEPFAILDKNVNGHYYKLFDNKLFFKYDGQYDVTGLFYYLYDKDHEVVASFPVSNTNLVNITSVKPGDNRYTLNAATLPAGPYLLEVINEKKERFYLRFKR